MTMAAIRRKQDAGVTPINDNPHPILGVVVANLPTVYRRLIPDNRKGSCLCLR
jgi:hypothetical protein